MKTAKEILQAKYTEVGAYIVDDTHMIAAMEEYASQFSGYYKIDENKVRSFTIRNWSIVNNRIVFFINEYLNEDKSNSLPKVFMKLKHTKSGRSVYVTYLNRQQDGNHFIGVRSVCLDDELLNISNGDEFVYDGYFNPKFNKKEVVG